MEKHLELYLRVDLHHQSVILKEADIILNNFNVAHLPCSVCVCVCVYVYIYIYIYRVSQEERTKIREGVPYVKLYRYNPKHLYPKLNGYGDNGKRSLKL